METAIFHINLEGVPVGNLRHIIFPLKVTGDLLQHIYFPPDTWICFSESVTLNFWLTKSYSCSKLLATKTKQNTVSLSGRLTAYEELNSKASIHEIDGAGMRGGWEMGKDENANYFQVFRQQNWKYEQQQFIFLPKDSPLENGNMIFGVKARVKLWFSLSNYLTAFNTKLKQISTEAQRLNQISTLGVHS